MADQVLVVKGRKIKEVSLYYNEDIIFEDFQFFDEKGKKIGYHEFDGGIEENDLSISIEEIFMTIDAATGKVLHWPKDYKRSVKLNALVEDKGTYNIIFADGSSIEIWDNKIVPDFLAIEEYSTDHINFTIDKNGFIKNWVEKECPKMIADTYFDMTENNEKPFMRKNSDENSSSEHESFEDDDED